jgi:hypothetical protein
MRHLLTLLLVAVFTPLVTLASTSSFGGQWKLDKDRSTALDGWHDWELVVRVSGTHVELQHNMKWGRTEVTETNTIDTSRETVVPGFFRVGQRHMAVYPAKGGETKVSATWLDEGRTLRVEAEAPVEISQGQTVMRIYSEYRLLEGDDTLVLIELHNTRPQPLVYRFTRVTETK